MALAGMSPADSQFTTVAERTNWATGDVISLDPPLELRTADVQWWDDLWFDLDWLEENLRRAERDHRDQRVQQRLRQYQAAEPNLRPDTVAGMTAFLRCVPAGMPFPSLGLGDDGSLSAEWDVRPLHLLVGFDGAGPTDAAAYFHDEAGEQIEWADALARMHELRPLMCRIAGRPQWARPIRERSAPRTLRDLPGWSGLTWRHLAALFGVAVTTVHGWADETHPMGDADRDQLQRLCWISSAVAGVDADGRRACWLAPRGDRGSLFEALAAERKAGPCG